MTHFYKNTQSNTVQSPTLRQNQLLNICGAKGKTAETLQRHLWELFGTPVQDSVLPCPQLGSRGPPPARSALPLGPAQGPAPPPTSLVMSRLGLRRSRSSARRRRSRPREVTAALGSAAGPGGGHPSGAGATWLGDNPIATRGAISDLFFLYFSRTFTVRAPLPSAETATPPPGSGRSTRPPERHRPPAGANLEPPPPPSLPGFSQSLGGRQGLGPGHQARRCGVHSSPRGAPGLAGPSAAPS